MGDKVIINVQTFWDGHTLPDRVIETMLQLASCLISAATATIFTRCGSNFHKFSLPGFDQ